MLETSGFGVSHLIALLVGLVPLLIYVLTNQKKKLGYAITRNFEIITLNDESIADQVSILVNGEPKQNVRTSQILLQNIGIKDIENIRIDINFSPETKIVSSQVGYDPPTFVSEFKIATKNSFQLGVPLMNPGDKITVNCLTENNKSGKCTVSAKAPSFVCYRFDPFKFVSPLINTIVNVACILIWLAASIFATKRILAIPDQSIWGSLVLIVLVSVMTALLLGALREGTLDFLKRMRPRFG